jgi:CHAT domain-containing protein
MTRNATVLGLALAAGLLAAPRVSLAAEIGDFPLGPNAETEACRAVARFDAPKGARSADVYCGAWERPSGRVTWYPNEAAARAAEGALCPGDATALQAADFSELKQIACTRNGQTGPRRYALIARRGQGVVIGEVYPSDWAPLVSAARVLSGAAKAPRTAAGATPGETPGLREIQAVYPAGPPGQGAAANYELLRRRAYEYNLIWSFDTAQRDFEELLRLQKQVAPDDTASEAEILAEIGLNMSSARRFDEAAANLAQAQAMARSAGDALLATKVLNYLAIDQLNQRHYGAAFRLAQQANAARAELARGGPQATGTQITAGDVGRVERRRAVVTQRSLLVSFTDAPAVDRPTILSAQGSYIAAVAARGLGRPDEAVYLDAAAGQLQQLTTPTAWLVGEITNERAEQKSAAGDYAGAAAAAQTGLAMIKTVAPGTRGEAHLWLTLEAAQASLGQTQAALESGRAALAIYGRQMESPGLPADIAAAHLKLLGDEWRRTGDAKLAEEYFQCLSLVWDGAAARTTAQLAARLVLRQAGDQARSYQDAERAYRASLARRQVLAGDSDATPAQIAAADGASRAAAARLAAAEGVLRDKAPAYLELLNPQASADDLRAALADHEAYLRLALGSRGGFGVLVDKDGVHPFDVALTQDKADALVDRLRRSTHLRGRRLPDFDVEASQALYAALIAPVKDRLAGVSDLDVDVSGALASVPFAELLEAAPNADQLQRIEDAQDYSGLAWLGRRVAVANALGPASFVRLRKAAPAAPATLHATVYGDYVPNPHETAARLAKANGLSDACRDQIERVLTTLGPLPDTADEARSVAAKFPGSRLVLGPAFTDADVLGNAGTGDADVIMLATHGVLAVSSCFAEPALLTSVGDTGDGLVEASQLFDRQLKARIVVLSACDTAAGGKLDEARTGLGDGGDALSGLARGFIYAGARDVLATEWKVDSAASNAEMNAFFDQAGKPGVDLGQALAAAQKQLFDTPETAHPFYWAGFVLVGDGGGVLGGAAATKTASAAP